MLDELFDPHTDEGRERFRLFALSIIRAGGCFALALLMGYFQPHPIGGVFLPAVVIGACSAVKLTMPVALVGLSILLAQMVLPVGFLMR